MTKLQMRSWVNRNCRFASRRGNGVKTAQAYEDFIDLGFHVVSKNFHFSPIFLYESPSTIVMVLTDDGYTVARILPSQKMDLLDKIRNGTNFFIADYDPNCIDTQDPKEALTAARAAIGKSPSDPASDADPRDRLYDLGQKGPDARTPREQAEYESLKKKFPNSYYAGRAQRAKRTSHSREREK